MVVTGFKSVEWSLLTVISLIFCIISTTAAESRAAVRSVLDCDLDNDTQICTGAQYRMHCNTRMNRFSYQRYQYQNQYQCMSNDCFCVGNNDTCACYYNTSSCFCENTSNSITIPTTVSPVYDCGLYNDTYICTGAQFRMYCNTSVHDFNYWRYQYQDQYQDQYLCMSNDCYCVGNKDTCTCYSSTLSSCFCETNIYTPTTTGLDQSGLDLLIVVSVIVGLVFLSSALLTFALCRWTRMCDWIVGHSGCVRLLPGGYVRELSGSSTGNASDVDSNPTTSKVSQEKHCNITLTLERVNQNIYTNA